MAPTATDSMANIGLVAGMLVTGSLNTLAGKGQFNTESKNSVNQTVPFQHPFVQSYIMFYGEFTCLIAFVIYRHMQGVAARKGSELEEREPLNQYNGKESKGAIYKRPIFSLLFAIPACLDIVGTTMGAIGLIYIPASVWQMLRGSIILFTGLFSWFFLKRQLKETHWLGMGLAFCGLLLVGTSSFIDKKGDSGGKHSGIMVAVGIGCVLGAQVFAATQMVVEELFLQDKDFHPLQVVGNEGMFGILFMTFIVLPAAFFVPGSQPSYPLKHSHNLTHNETYKGSYDNAIDGFIQIGNSSSLLALCLIFVCSIAFYNFFGMSVTKRLTAVHRTLVDACRTLVIFIVEIILFYASSATKSYGEEVTKGTALEVVGFIVLVTGSFIYNGVLKVPFGPFRDEPAKPAFAIIQDEEIPPYSKSISEKRPLLRPTNGRKK